MNIPLHVRSRIQRSTNLQQFDVWRNSKKITVGSPIKPYFMSTYPLCLKCRHEVSKHKKKLLSNLKEEEVWKYSFDNTKYVEQYREDDSIEADIVFTDRVLIDNEDFFLKYPNTDKLKVLAFDIETDSTGMFPHPDRNAIIGIGCSCEGDKKIYLSKTYDDDKEILTKFFDFVKKHDPDIITHYNGNRFDIPYMLPRMEKHNIPKDLWSRDRTEPYFFKDTMHLGGRISFDIYNEVERDQTIYGIKNHKMKTVAKWIDKEGKLDITEVELSDMRSLVYTNELKKYLKSDVNITEFLFKVYFRNVLMLAEMNKIPLNLMVDASPSFLPRIIHGRPFHKTGIVSDKNNMNRYPIYINKKQGALVQTYNPGLYRQLYKVDFSSQYPRTVQTFNISPETCKIVRYENMDKNYWSNYKFILGDKVNTFIIPDNNANKNIIIEVDKHRGFLAQFMEDVLTDRFRIKSRMKTIDKNSTEYGLLHVQQNALKVVANVQTGYQGQKFARFGSLACYNMITGMARWYVMLAINWCKDNGIKVISVDTDGIYIKPEKYISGTEDVQKILNDLNNYLDIYTEKTFGTQNYLHMDIDEYDAAYFRKTKGKHYVLKDKDKIKFHGQSFKGSHLPKFFDSVLEQVARDLFDNKADRKKIDITKFSYDELMQSIKVKDKSEYKSGSSLSMQLIRKAEREFPDIKLMDGDQLSYIKCNTGYELVVPGKTYDIDIKYYQNIIHKIYDRLDIEDKRQLRFK